VRKAFLGQLFKHEALGGIILFMMAVAALIMCNSPWAAAYQTFWQVPLAINIADYDFSQPLLFWVNEGLMTLFFLLVGLELKREFLTGELKAGAQIILPAMAALGGMLVPVIIYWLINAHDAEKLVGWSIPVATDIAFALGVLSLFGKRIPPALKLFLLALAIFDDLGAILIIAFYHSAALSWWSLGLSLVMLMVLVLFNRAGVQRLSFYLLAGLMLWICVLQSGVHATVAGVLLALLIPINSTARRAPALRLEDSLSGWVAFFVMPLFAFANAGVSLQGITFNFLQDHIVLGVVLGLFFGKQIGVLVFSWLAIKLGWSKLPTNTSWLQLYGVAILCGIGFTMSLFLGTLAFANHSEYMMQVRIAVLIASIISGLFGALILQYANRQ
jgi:NhaA family Na+:H+ antiporter